MSDKKEKITVCDIKGKTYATCEYAIKTPNIIVCRLDQSSPILSQNNRCDYRKEKYVVNN